MNFRGNNLLKKKWITIPTGIILYIILLATMVRTAGVITILGAVGLGYHLFAKKESFKQKNKFIKTLTGFGLAIIILSGAAFTSMTPEKLEQSRLVAEKAKVEQQAQEKQKADQAKKEADEKVKKQAEEDAKKKAAQEAKANQLAKFNLKEAKIVRVVGGDTIEATVDGKDYKIRFIGINTPESTTKQEPYGKEASEYTKSKLEGKTVYLEKDTSEADQYGRLLRYVWIDIPSEINDNEIRSKMFNAILTLNGYAQQVTYPPDVKYADYFGKYAAEARISNKGLWAINSNGTTKGDNTTATSGSNSSSNVSSYSSTSNTSSPSSSSATVQQVSAPQTAQSNNQSTTVYVTKTGKKYHVAGCKYLSKSKIPISLDEAKKSYEPCSVCHPPQ